jgi:hypothetical protein
MIELPQWVRIAFFTCRLLRHYDDEGELHERLRTRVIKRSCAPRASSASL